VTEEKVVVSIEVFFVLSIGTSSEVDFVSWLELSSKEKSASKFDLLLFFFGNKCTTKSRLPREIEKKIDPQMKTSVCETDPWGVLENKEYEVEKKNRNRSKAFIDFLLVS
jgi:hypothetical protein